MYWINLDASCQGRLRMGLTLQAHNFTHVRVVGVKGDSFALTPVAAGPRVVPGTITKPGSLHGTHLGLHHKGGCRYQIFETTPQKILKWAQLGPTSELGCHGASFDATIRAKFPSISFVNGLASPRGHVHSTFHSTAPRGLGTQTISAARWPTMTCDMRFTVSRALCANLLGDLI